MNHYQLQPDPQGSYYRADGTRYELLSVKNIRTPQGYNVGWTPFETLEACLAAWQLEASTKYEVRSTKFEECAPDGAEASTRYEVRSTKFEECAPDGAEASTKYPPPP